MKLLVIDDSEIMRTFIGDCAEKAGLEMTGEAGDGEEGIIKYKELNPNLVILDISMPKVGGLDCLKAIKKYDKNAKVIICSASSHKAAIRKALEMGAIDFIAKPFKDEDLVLKLETIKSTYDKLEKRGWFFGKRRK